MINVAMKLAEKGMLPDFIIRKGINNFIKQRHDKEMNSLVHNGNKIEHDFISKLKNSPIAIVPEKANEQHYEVPPKFFKNALGINLKYSSCYYPTGMENLDEAEKEMLELTCKRAEITDGMDILELGCGWGSLTLFMAIKYPNSSITAVSNSNNQREFILEKAEELGLDNIKIITKDINELEINNQFDRIVSVEMFEHLRNYQLLFNKIKKMLKVDGKVFVHIFCHELFAYPYEVIDESDWMAKYFFSGGIMPSFRLFEKFNHDLEIEKKWKVNGIHYMKTANHWLKNIDKNKDHVLTIFENSYDKNESRKWFFRWRMFFMACEELFGFNNGKDWFVGHYLFTIK